MFSFCIEKNNFTDRYLLFISEIELFYLINSDVSRVIALRTCIISVSRLLRPQIFQRARNLLTLGA